MEQQKTRHFMGRKPIIYLIFLTREVATVQVVISFKTEL